MIDDPELRSLFQAESEERLRSLEEGLKAMQEDPTDIEILEEIFRDAHTIKGSARMLNIHSVEQLSHSLEDGLDIARQAKMPLTPLIIDIAFQGIDAIRQFVDEEVSGTKPTVELAQALNQLKNLGIEIEKELSRVRSGVFEGEEPKKEEPEVPKPIETAQKVEVPRPQPTPAAAPTTPAPQVPTTSEMVSEEEKKAKVGGGEESKSQVSPGAGPIPAASTVRKEVKKEAPPSKPVEAKRSYSTIRIDTHQINELLTQAADLTVAKNRIFRLFEQIEEILEYWEKKGRTLGQYISDTLAQNEESLNNAAARELSVEYAEAHKKIVDQLSKLRADSYGDIHKLEIIASSFVDRIRKLTLVPFSKLFDLFPRMVQDVAKACNKEVDFIMEGGEITVDKKIIEDMKDPIMHLLRNSISHGIESTEVREKLNKPKKGIIHLRAQQTSNSIIIEIIDDGKGIRLEDIKAKALEKGMFSESELAEMSDAEIQSLIFQPGFSTAAQISNISGRGVGLDVVQNTIKKLNGTLQVESEPGKGTRFIIQLAITLVNTHVMLFQVDKRSYAIPIELIESCNLISIDRLSTIEGYDVVFIQDQPISLVSLRKLLGLETHEITSESPGATPVSLFSCIVLNFTGKRLAVIVDAILDEQKVVVTPPGLLLSSLRWLVGETILKTGEVCMILNPFDLMQMGPSSSSLGFIKKKKQGSHRRKKRILLVDDSYTTRLMVSRELEEEGFEILQAINGAEGLDILKKTTVDAVISDVEMPEMDGLSMVSQIRRNKDLYALPIIMMSTKASPEDRQKGLEVGANHYMAKSEYNQSDLIKILKELL